MSSPTVVMFDYIDIVYWLMVLYIIPFISRNLITSKFYLSDQSFDVILLWETYGFIY